MVIQQGDVFWASLPPAVGSGPGFRHPAVVIQNNVFNQSRIATCVVCMIASNLTLAAAPGNVLLAKGEANLSKRSVVNVSQIYTLDKIQLIQKIGTLSKPRAEEVLEGVKKVLARSW
jgi:mRNA interferase MazF